MAENDFCVLEVDVVDQNAVDVDVAENEPIETEIGDMVVMNTGAPGSVTKNDIETALGYTPADEEDVAALQTKLSDVSDFVNDLNSDISTLYNDVADLHKTENYIFTGSYTNVEGQYQVALDDNYSWDNLVGAVRGGRYVVCVLFDEDKLLPLTFTAGEVFVEDGYVNLHSDGEGTVRRELYIYENGDLELYEISLATRAEMAGKLDTYIFTGEYTHNADGTYTVAFDDNYSWNKLVFAVSNNMDIRCVLTDGDYKILLTFARDYIIDGYVVLTSVEEGAHFWQLEVYKSSQFLSTHRIARYSELLDKLNAYVFSGQCTARDGGGYGVVLGAGYNWISLSNAVASEKFVVCILTFDTGNKIYMTLTESYLGDDEYVVFTANVESSFMVYKLLVRSDGDALLYFDAMATMAYVQGEIARLNVLPAVTEADNGKVLKVVNGVWTAVSA